MIRKLFSATAYALQGLRALIKTEFAFRLECALSLILIPLACFMAKGPTQLALLLFSWFLVLIIEAINSSIEAAVDFTSLDHHPLAEKAKNIGATAVLLAIANATLTWTLIFLF